MTNEKSHSSQSVNETATSNSRKGLYFGAALSLLTICGLYAFTNCTSNYKSSRNNPTTTNHKTESVYSINKKDTKGKEVWADRNDYNDEATGLFWIIDPSTHTIDYTPDYEDYEYSTVITSWNYKEITWKEFKNLYPSARVFYNSNVRTEVNIPISTRILLVGPEKNESETWEYPVYMIVVPLKKSAPTVFINCPDGPNTFLSISKLTKIK